MRLLLVLILFSLSVPVISLAAKGPEEMEFPSRWGTVTFQHHQHQARGIDCQACHHRGEEMGPCRSCHGLLPTTPLRKDILHKLCKDCHREQRGPTDCVGCHDPATVEESVFNDN